MTLTLVRHGETDWNVAKKIQGCTDIPLNETGIFQAHELGSLLQENVRRGLAPNYTHIYSSPLRRAMTTGEIIGSYLGLSCEPLAGLEEINLGAWEGYTWEQVKADFSTEYQMWYENRRYHRPPQGESYQDLLERILPTLQRILQKEGNYLLVCHSAIVMTLLSYLHDTPFHQMHRNYKTKNTGTILLSEEQLEIIKRYQS